MYDYKQLWCGSDLKFQRGLEARKGKLIDLLVVKCKLRILRVDLIDLQSETNNFVHQCSK